MGVINCSPELFKNSTPGLDIELFPGELTALLAHPRRAINSSAAFFKYEGLTFCRTIPPEIFIMVTMAASIEAAMFFRHARSRSCADDENRV
jgi:hypothetical protein